MGIIWKYNCGRCDKPMEANCKCEPIPFTPSQVDIDFINSLGPDTMAIGQRRQSKVVEEIQDPIQSE